MLDIFLISSGHNHYISESTAFGGAYKAYPATMGHPVEWNIEYTGSRIDFNTYFLADDKLLKNTYFYPNSQHKNTKTICFPMMQNFQYGKIDRQDGEVPIPSSDIMSIYTYRRDGTSDMDLLYKANWKTKKRKYKNDIVAYEHWLPYRFLDTKESSTQDGIYGRSITHPYGVASPNLTLINDTYRFWLEYKPSSFFANQNHIVFQFIRREQKVPLNVLIEKFDLNNEQQELTKQHFRIMPIDDIIYVVTPEYFKTYADNLSDHIFRARNKFAEWTSLEAVRSQMGVSIDYDKIFVAFGKLGANFQIADRLQETMVRL